MMLKQENKLDSPRELCDAFFKNFQLCSVKKKNANFH